MAAGRNIKGITIEIDGNSTGLQKALKDANSEVRDTQAQLRDVERLLKLDPSNTELLAQKQKLLADAISETKGKLDTLATASEQAKQALDTGEISQKQYDALQREIIATEQELKKLEDKAKDSKSALESIGEAGEKIKSAGDKVAGVGEKLLPITAGVAAIGTAAVKTTADFDAGMSNVSAISGATGEDLDKLRAKAREMGSQTKFSATEAADAMSYMAMAGWKTDDMMGSIAGVMNLAAASGEDLASTSDIVTDAMTAFGLSADGTSTVLKDGVNTEVPNATRFVDVLAAACNNSNTNVSMLGESFKYVSATAGSMGYSVEDTAVALGLMANQGIKASNSGTALRTLIVNMAKPSKQMQAAMDGLGLSLTNADGSTKSLMEVMQNLREGFSGGSMPIEEFQQKLTELNTEFENGEIDEGWYEASLKDLTTQMYGVEGAEKAQYAAMLAGKTGMAGLMAIVNTSDEDFQKLSDSIYNSSGTAESMAETMQDNLGGQLTILKSQLEELAISFGEILMPKIRKIVSAIQEFVDKLNSMSDGQRKVVIVLMAVAAAIGPLLVGIGKTIVFVGQIMTFLPKVATAIKAVKGGISAVNAVMAANPIILIVAAVAAVIAALVLVYNKCDWFREAVDGVWAGIKEAFTAAWDGIVTFFTETLPAAWNAVVEWVQNIPEWWEEIWTKVGEFFTNLWNSILENPIVSNIVDGIKETWNGLIEDLSAIWENIKGAAEGAWELIKNVVLGPVLLLVDLVTGNFDKLKEDAAKIWDNIKENASKVWTNLKEGVTKIVDDFKEGVTNTFENVKENAAKIWDNVKETASKVWSDTKDKVCETASKLKDGVIEAWENTKKTVSDKVTKIKEDAVQGFENLCSKIRDTVNNLPQIIENGFSGAISFIKGLPSQAIQWGADFINGMVDGIWSAIGNVTDAVSGVGDRIREYLHFSVPDKGPLTDYESWMPDFMQGLAKGIEKSKGLVADAIEGVAGDMTINANAMVTNAGSNRDASGVLNLLAQYLPYLAQGTVLQWDTGEVAAKLAPDMNRQLGRIASEGGYL